MGGLGLGLHKEEAGIRGLLICNMKSAEYSMRVDEGRKGWILLAIKMKARTVVGRGEEGPLCDPGSELLLGGSARV